MTPGGHPRVIFERHDRTIDDVTSFSPNPDDWHWRLSATLTLWVWRLSAARDGRLSVTLASVHNPALESMNDVRASDRCPGFRFKYDARMDGVDQSDFSYCVKFKIFTRFARVRLFFSVQIGNKQLSPFFYLEVR